VLVSFLGTKFNELLSTVTAQVVLFAATVAIFTDFVGEKREGRSSLYYATPKNYFRLTKSKLPIISLLFLRVISVFAVRSINTIAQPLNAIILVSFEESRNVTLQIAEELALRR
jgi:hypothetical protein